MCATAGAGAADSLDLFDAAITSGGSGQLDAHVAGVVKMIFNVDTMRSTLLEMQIDSSKLPLGALTRERLLSGCSVLSQIAALIEEGGESPKDTAAKMKLIDGSNHFFTIVPHSFGAKSVPVIDTVAQVQQHMKTIEALLEMETATKLIRLEQPANTAILDSCFAKLHIDMKHLPSTSPTYHTLDMYLQRTLASTHKAKYDLEIVDAFSVSRHCEADRFEPWLDLHNHQVLPFAPPCCISVTSYARPPACPVTNALSYSGTEAVCPTSSEFCRRASALRRRRRLSPATCLARLYVCC